MRIQARLMAMLAAGAFACAGLVACDSDDDGKKAQDVAADAGADAAGTDTVTTPDVPETPDTTPSVDTAPPEDTAPPQDTAPPKDTTPPQDTTPQDTAPPTKICLEHTACVVEACKTAAEADVATCIAAAETTCGLAPSSGDTEVDAAWTLVECFASHNCVADGSNKQWSCASAYCTVEAAACQAGTWGTGSCNDVRACSVACAPDMFGTPDYACLRGCAAEGTQQAVEYYMKLRYCLDEQCWDKDPTEKATCEQQAQNSGFCSIPFVDCQGAEG